MVIEDGILKKVDDKDIVDGKFEIPEGVTEIGEEAFSGRQELTYIEIPEEVTKIGR